MPQEPKRRHSKARKRTRRASIMLDKINLVKCTNCGKPSIPHQVCKYCGTYDSEQVKAKTKVEVVKA